MLRTRFECLSSTTLPPERGRHRAVPQRHVPRRRAGRHLRGPAGAPPHRRHQRCRRGRGPGAPDGVPGGVARGRRQPPGREQVTDHGVVCADADVPAGVVARQRVSRRRRRRHRGRRAHSRCGRQHPRPPQRRGCEYEALRPLRRQGDDAASASRSAARRRQRRHGGRQRRRRLPRRRLGADEGERSGGRERSIVHSCGWRELGPPQHPVPRRRRRGRRRRPRTARHCRGAQRGQSGRACQILLAMSSNAV